MSVWWGLHKLTVSLGREGGSGVGRWVSGCSRLFYVSFWNSVCVVRLVVASEMQAHGSYDEVSIARTDVSATCVLYRT